MTTLFITGIDTDIGKSIACGALAKKLIEAGHHLFTQKLVETGCINAQSADLATHKNIVGKTFNTGEFDQHCPYTFSFAASPHLAAEREGKTIDSSYLAKQIQALENQCDHLLVEGAGGLNVPLNRQSNIIDFIADNNLPIVLVTSAKLGSINHTLLSLQACLQRDIEVRAIIYNHHGQDEVAIVADTREVLQAYIKTLEVEPIWLELEKNNFDISITEDNTGALLSL